MFKGLKNQQEVVVYNFIALNLPFRDFTGPIATFGNIIERLSQFASAASGCVAVDAYVKVLTVVGVGVARVCRGHSLVHLWALELEHL